jgi:quinol monooxygenase YgiN
MTKFAIYAELKAKPGKGEEVAAFLASAQSLVLNEPETVAWFAVRFDDRTFGVFDAFNEESGRRAHLSGPIAEALMSRAAELLEAMPTIRQPDVIADKLPG